MKHPGHTYGGFVPAISERGMTVKLHSLHRSVVPIGVIVLLGLCNPPRRGHGEPAKHGLLYALVWIPCCDTVSEKPGSQSRVGSIASDLESWVMCCDRED
jgi:hypothetical protein